jgi:hypothetical protein
MGLGSVVAIAGLVITPFGDVSHLLQAEKPWYGFEPQGPVLNLVRLQKTPVKSCKAWSDALVAVPETGFTPVSVSDPSSTVKNLQASWEPLSEKDLKAIKSCDEFPCKVKLNEPETTEMKKAKEPDRVGKFFSIVGSRLESYSKTQVRKGYEYPGEPVDPWKTLEERGFKTTLPRPEKPDLYARKLNFAPNKMLTMHQVLDRRVARSPQDTEAVVWVRDAYTDHYFDSWGEWSMISCDPSTHEAVVIQALLSEMDLLKSKGLFARAAFGKFRSAFKDNGKVFLDQQFDQLKKAAEKLEAPH